VPEAFAVSIGGSVVRGAYPDNYLDINYQGQKGHNDSGQLRKINILEERTRQANDPNKKAG
jgi:hypothetical protein